MAVIYLSSVDGNNADDGSTWALAKATLAAALTAAGAGGTVYMDNAHAETQASTITLSSPGTAASPTRVLCVSRASGEPPTTLATTGTVSATGASNILYGGYAYFYGFKLRSGSGASTGSVTFTANADTDITLEDCGIVLNNTSSSSRVIFGYNLAGQNFRFRLINTPITFGAVGQAIRQDQGYWEWLNTPSAIVGSVPTVLFSFASFGGAAKFIGVDLSAAGAGKSILSSTADGMTRMDIIDCKLGTSVSILSGAFSVDPNDGVTVINCDSADTNYRYYKSQWPGDITHETTIVRTGGATDGTTAISRKMVTTANSNWHRPLESDWMYFWNETTGSSVTVSVPVITDNVTLTDAEAWIEVEYLGTSGFPLGSFANDRATDILATPANQTTDGSSTWTTTGLTTPVKQTLSKAVTPQEKGVLRARVVLAKASTTMYFDPLILAGSGRQFQAGDTYANEAAAAASGLGNRIISAHGGLIMAGHP